MLLLHAARTTLNGGQNPMYVVNGKVTASGVIWHQGLKRWDGEKKSAKQRDGFAASVLYWASPDQMME